MDCQLVQTYAVLLLLRRPTPPSAPTSRAARAAHRRALRQCEAAWSRVLAEREAALRHLTRDDVALAG